MRVEAARQRCAYSVLAQSGKRRHCRRAIYELPLLLRLRAGRRRARAASDGRGPVVAEHNLASLSSPLALSDARLAPWTGFATVDLIKALGAFPCIKINQTAQPVRDGPPPHVGILTEKFQAA
jgi:hypothetical protein